MSLNKKDIKIERTKGKGPGGQHKNKTESMIKATHLPTGITVNTDGRNQHANKRKALKELEIRVSEHFAKIKAADKKLHRDIKIKERKIIRTYNYSTQRVKDHRTGKTASIKDIMEKGKLDLLK
uniref:Putative RF-1 domain containing protein n=1 Tax=viral metagenome TaxID=1070528 RepID=A0A6M3LBC1_9ZZZZ